VENVLALGPDTLVEGRPFTAPENTGQDAAVLATMLGRLRAFARGWDESAPGRSGFLVRGPDERGLRTWVRVPDRAALLAPGELTAVGFFGQARTEIDHGPIDELEAAIVDTLEHVPGMLSYYNQELPRGRYGNLILCADPDVPVRWHTHALHRRAVELAPRHYHSARLHDGVVGSPLLGAADLNVLRTRYYDFDSSPTWVAVRG
jgi:hypothetical protein